MYDISDTRRASVIPKEAPRQTVPYPIPWRRLRNLLAAARGLPSCRRTGGRDVRRTCTGLRRADVRAAASARAAASGLQQSENRSLALRPIVREERAGRTGLGMTDARATGAGLSENLSFRRRRRVNLAVPDALAPTEESTRGCSWPAVVPQNRRSRCPADLHRAPSGGCAGPRRLRGLPRRASSNPKIDSLALRPIVREERAGRTGLGNDRRSRDGGRSVGKSVIPKEAPRQTVPYPIPWRRLRNLLAAARELLS